jgi:excisionase family DNA binding protein
VKITSDDLLTSAEVADLFRVHQKTVVRWTKQGKLSCLRTPGGHRRYREIEVRALLNGSSKERTDG